MVIPRYNRRVETMKMIHFLELTSPVDNQKTSFSVEKNVLSKVSVHNHQMNKTVDGFYVSNGYKLNLFPNIFGKLPT